MSFTEFEVSAKKKQKNKLFSIWHRWIRQLISSSENASSQLYAASNILFTLFRPHSCKKKRKTAAAGGDSVHRLIEDMMVFAAAIIFP
jgi:hypothetical protein